MLKTGGTIQGLTARDARKLVGYWRRKMRTKTKKQDLSKQFTWGRTKDNRAKVFGFRGEGILGDESEM